MLNLQQDMDRGFVFQRDGAHPHFRREVNSYLKHTAIDWIGSGGTIAWPPRCPGLTHSEFSVWGYVNDKILFYLFLQVWMNRGHG
jgi:hypothetical protein